MGSELLSTQFAHPVAYDEGLESIALNKRYGNWWTSLGGAGLEINYQNATIGTRQRRSPRARRWTSVMPTAASAR